MYNGLSIPRNNKPREKSSNKVLETLSKKMNRFIKTKKKGETSIKEASSHVSSSSYIVKRSQKETSFEQSEGALTNRGIARPDFTNKSFIGNFKPQVLRKNQQRNLTGKRNQNSSEKYFKKRLKDNSIERKIGNIVNLTGNKFSKNEFRSERITRPYESFIDNFKERRIKSTRINGENELNFGGFDVEKFNKKLKEREEYDNNPSNNIESKINLHTIVEKTLNKRNRQKSQISGKSSIKKNIDFSKRNKSNFEKSSSNVKVFKSKEAKIERKTPKIKHKNSSSITVLDPESMLEIIDEFNKKLREKYNVKEIDLEEFKLKFSNFLNYTVNLQKEIFDSKEQNIGLIEISQNLNSRLLILEEQLNDFKTDRHSFIQEVENMKNIEKKYIKEIEESEKNYEELKFHINEMDANMGKITAENDFLVKVLKKSKKEIGFDRKKK